MTSRLHSLSDLSSLFGPDAKAPVTKNGSTAEAGCREVIDMESVHQTFPSEQWHSFSLAESAIPQSQREPDAARVLLNRLIQRAKDDGPFAVVVGVTPPFAALLLERNRDNRNLKQKVISEIASDIRDGRWKLNGETIILSPDGDVNDGQHRLRAIVEADRTVTVMIAVGLSRETRMSVDSNQTTKTPGDFVNMAGIEHGTTIAAVASYLIQIETTQCIPVNPHTGAAKPKKSVIIEYARKHGAAIRAASDQVPCKNSQLIASHSLLVVAFLLIQSRYQKREGDSDSYVVDFFKALLSGGEGANAPTFTIRELMMEDKRKRRFTQRRAIELIFRAWNAHRTGRTLAKAMSTGQWPAIEK